MSAVIRYAIKLDHPKGARYTTRLYTRSRAIRAIRLAKRLKCFAVAVPWRVDLTPAQIVREAKVRAHVPLQ